MSLMVFQSPGPEKIHGHSVAYKVIDEVEAEAHVAAGWFMSAIEAGEARLKAAIQTAEYMAEEIDDKAAATLDELRQKARELGLEFDGRFGVKRLQALIEQKLAE